MFAANTRSKMKFSKVLRGYSPQEVDCYLEALKTKYNEVFSAQRQRIDELSDENSELRNAISDYKQKEQSIVDSLVESQQLADSVRAEAEKFAEVTVLRAKEFYAAWQSYSQTLVKGLSDEEVAQFNEVLAKMEKLIDDFDGESVRDFSAKAVASAAEQEGGVSATETAARPTSAERSTSGKMQNPIKKVEESAGERQHVIELEELIFPTESLGDLCRSLGLKTDKE